MREVSHRPKKKWQDGKDQLTTRPEGGDRRADPSHSPTLWSPRLTAPTPLQAVGLEEPVSLPPPALSGSLFPAQGLQLSSRPRSGPAAAETSTVASGRAMLRQASTWLAPFVPPSAHGPSLLWSDGGQWEMLFQHPQLEKQSEIGGCDFWLRLFSLSDQSPVTTSLSLSDPHSEVGRGVLGLPTSLKSLGNSREYTEGFKEMKTSVPSLPTAPSWACSRASWAQQMVTIPSAWCWQGAGLLSTPAQACLQTQPRHPAPHPTCPTVSWEASSQWLPWGL